MARAIGSRLPGKTWSAPFQAAPFESSPARRLRAEPEDSAADGTRGLGKAPLTAPRMSCFRLPSHSRCHGARWLRHRTTASRGRNGNASASQGGGKAFALMNRCHGAREQAGRFLSRRQQKAPRGMDRAGERCREASWALAFGLRLPDVRPGARQPHDTASHAARRSAKSRAAWREPPRPPTVHGPSRPAPPCHARAGVPWLARLASRLGWRWIQAPQAAAALTPPHRAPNRPEGAHLGEEG